MIKNNFLQVSPHKSECGACHPEKYVDCKQIKNYECNCICHGSACIEFCYVCKEKICGATVVEDFNKIRHAECEKQCVHDKPLEVCEDCNEDCKDWTKGFDQEFIKWADNYEELKKALKQFIFNLINKRELPPAVGVSQWKNYGIKYKYWDFFRSEIMKEVKNIIKSHRPSHEYCDAYNQHGHSGERWDLNCYGEQEKDKIIDLILKKLDSIK